jgi:cell division inhibitor SepF
MSLVSMAKNFFGLDESDSHDELPMREAIPISSRQGYRPAPVTKSRKSAVYEMNEIFTIDAHSFADAQRIAEEYRDGKTVIVNLGELSDIESRRVVDFISGLTYGLHGEPRRVTAKVFLLAHNGVSIEGETAAEADSVGDELYIRP